MGKRSKERKKQRKKQRKQDQRRQSPRLLESQPAPRSMQQMRPAEFAAPAITTGDQRLLSEQIATRDRSWDAWSISAWLPNPDPVLKALGTDISTYRALRADAHVGGCIRRRKAAVRALDAQWEANGCPVRVLKSLQGILADLTATPDPDEPGALDGITALTAEALDGALYGYQPLELTWGRVGGLLVPQVVQGKPPEWFHFDGQNRLRFRASDRGVDGELVPGRKFLLARQDPTYANPYGLPDLSLVFWPATFRKGGAKFWTRWLEKYGGTLLLGKLPRSAPASDYDDLAQRLAEMVEDAVAAIPDDGSVEPLESGDKAGSSDAFERYMLYWRGEITIALLGSNQGMETDSTHASASAALSVGDDIRDSDARMVAGCVNQLLRWTCAVNWPGATPPRWVLREQEEIDQVRPARDKILTEAGVRLSRAYWLRTYDLEEGDVVEERDQGAVSGVAGAGDQMPPIALAAPGASPLRQAIDTPDQLDQMTARLSREAQPAVQAMVDQVRAMTETAGSLEELAAMIAAAYPQVDSGPLAATMGQALLAARLGGMAEVQAEGA